MKIALISCSKEKRSYPCKAYELYSASTLFSLSYQYAKKNADRIYILSAKYGLLPDDRVIEPYDQTLKEMNRAQQIQWAQNVSSDLYTECDPHEDTFIILAGRDYSLDLVIHLQHCILPLEGMRMGERMAFLKAQLRGESKDLLQNVKLESRQSADPIVGTMCMRLHTLFNEMPRYTWEQIDAIPFSDGIYIVFETGERYHDCDRIVRVGTHTSPDRLKRRLKDHFLNENHDGSIFRKNIGKAILNAHHDDYLPIWTMNTSRLENQRYMDKQKNADTERRVSEYMRKSFTFTAFPVVERDQRLRLEEAIISTLNHSPDFGPSVKWSGNHSPETEIRTSGMWLKQGLDAKMLTEQEYSIIKNCCGMQPAQPQAYGVVRSERSSARKGDGSLGKYMPLFKYLCAQTADELDLSFSEIEKILGFSLPKSAYTYTMWWNPGGTHTQCLSWTKAGYKVVYVQQGIDEKKMTFLKV